MTRPSRAARVNALFVGVVATLASLLIEASARADDDRPEAVPYRPTVSTPAQLSAPGWLEVELGGLRADDPHPDADPRRRSSVPYALKLAWSDDWGIRLQGDAFVRQTSGDGHVAAGVGDTAIVLKRRLALDEASAFGLEAGVDLPTAPHRIGTGSGQTDYSLDGIFSSDFATGWHTDVNAVGTRLGAVAPHAGRLQALGAWDVSRGFADRWTAAVELSGTHERRAPGTAQALGALSYAARRDIVLDFGCAHALNRATPNWQFFGGATVVVGKLF